MTETAQTPEETVATAELATICQRRGATYGFLARLFRKEVDEELLAELKSMRFPASTGSDAMDEGHKLLVNYLSKTWDHTLTDLAVDYTRVFIGADNINDSAAYPFESVYTSEKRLLMQEARDEVLAIYRAYGLDKNESWREGEDHIALELEFMKTLCERAAEALTEGDEAQAELLLTTQQNFLNDHLGSWAPMLTADMKQFSKTDFYLALANMTEGFLALEKEFLAELFAEEE